MMPKPSYDILGELTQYYFGPDLSSVRNEIIQHIQYNTLKHGPLDTSIRQEYIGGGEITLRKTAMRYW